MPGVRAVVVILVVTASVMATAAPTPFDPLGESMPRFSPAVSWWINWLIVIGATSILFAWKHVGARWVLGAYVANHAVALGIGSSLGPDMLTNGLVSLTHVVFWTPAVIMLVRGMQAMDRTSIYGAWHIAALLTMMTSLFFDYRDSTIYLFTDP